jgi:hypothetical protein
MEQSHRNTRALGATRRVRRIGTVLCIVAIGALATALVSPALSALEGTASAAASTSPPLSISNFVIVDPAGNVTSHGGPVTLAPGSGQHQFVFDTVGYRFSVINTSKVLLSGRYSTAVDTWLSLVNDPSCNGGTTVGSAEIDQATYDETGSVTSAAVQFQFHCDSGTYVYGSIAYEFAMPSPQNGYYLSGPSGQLLGFGNASYLTYLGNPYTRALVTSVIGMAATPDDAGYFMAGTDGGIFSFGDAQFYGSMGGKHLNAPIVGIAATADGLGYWLVASDGGIFSFGDAQFYGSMGGKHLNAPIVGIASSPSGHGYFEAASDGGVFTFGDANFRGSAVSTTSAQSTVGIASG